MKRFFLIVIALCAAAAAASAQTRVFPMERWQLRAFVGSPGALDYLRDHTSFGNDLAATYEPQYRDYVADNAIVGAEYDFRISKKSYLGASLSWTMAQDVCYDAVEDEAIGIRDIHNFYLMGHWRWNWWANHRMSLYSGLGLGVQFSIFLQEGYSTKVDATDVAWQVNYIGLEYSFSDRFAGFADAVAGNSAVGLRLGVSLKF